MLLMVEKGIRGVICHAIHRYAKANVTNTWKILMKMKKLCISTIDINNLYGWEMLQILFVGGFEWVENICQISKDFLKICNEYSEERYFLYFDVQYPEILSELHIILPFLSKRMKFEKIWKKTIANLHDKE